MARVAALLLLAMLALGALADVVPPTVENVDHSRHHHDWEKEHHEHHEHHELAVRSFTLYDGSGVTFVKTPDTDGDGNPDDGISGTVGRTATVTYGLACTKTPTAAATVVCHQAGIFVPQSELEPNQNLLQNLACEIKSGSCTAGAGQLFGIGLKSHAFWGDVDGAGTNIYPVQFSITGGTGAYSNVIGGTVTFTQSNGATFNLRYVK